jgi:hypothetical protein
MSSGAPDSRYVRFQARLAETHGPFVELTRHFLQRLLRPPILTEAGADSFRTVIAGVLAAVLALGMLLPRVFRQRYTVLAYLPGPEPYLQALVADQVFIMSVVMLLSGFAIVAIAHALLPDEIDFVTLSPLPVTREYIFFANAAAMALALGTYTLASVGLFGVAFSIVSTGRWAEDTVTARTLAHLAAGIGSSVFVYAIVLGLHAGIAFVAPRRLFRRLSLVLQSGLAFGLIASLPAIASIPGLARGFAENPRAMLLIPPAWFAGVEHWLLGSRTAIDNQLALRALAGTGIAVAAAVAGYVLSYRRFDRLATHTAGTRVLGASRAGPARLLAEPSEILAFIGRTIGRSRIHQLVVFGIMACGLALVLNSLMTAALGRWTNPRPVPPTVLWRAAISMPLLLTFMSVLALRASFRLPVDLQANWIFRLTDDPAHRPAQIDAVERGLLLFGLVPSLVLSLPVHYVVLGPARTMMTLSTTGLLGALLIQYVLWDWRRVPFTCTYLPGRRLFAFTVSIFVATFAVFVLAGGGLAAWSTTHPARFLLAVGLLLASFAWSRRRRLRVRGLAPMAFVDEPDDAIRLGLSG